MSDSNRPHHTAGSAPCHKRFNKSEILTRSARARTVKSSLEPPPRMTFSRISDLKKPFSDANVGFQSLAGSAGQMPFTSKQDLTAPSSDAPSAESPTKTRTYNRWTHMFDPKPRRPESLEASSSWDIELEPETHPITEDQLITEVRGIYAGLVMVEKKCMEIVDKQDRSTTPLTDKHWQAMTALHRTLLHEHHDFFLASQHPSASPVLKSVAEKYAMPARLWRYGIHGYLELLRRKLPQSFDHMVNFIYLAYSMMTLLLESVQAFEETWIECLGDLARYQMAVQEHNVYGREVWASVARYWYHKVADRSPHVGRIQHHLAVLSRPDIIQQLFFYTKSLVSIEPFVNTRESIQILFAPLSTALKAEKSHSEYPTTSAFVCAHGSLYSQGCTDEFITLAKSYLLQLGDYISQAGSSFRRQGAQMASCNIAAVFEYGNADAILPSEFSATIAKPPQEIYASAIEHWSSQPLSNMDRRPDSPSPRGHLGNISCGSYLSFLSLSTIVDRPDDENVYPAVHVYLAFIWCLALNGIKSMKYIEEAVPWSGIARFLNSLYDFSDGIKDFECEDFPSSSGQRRVRQLPEDFLIRGQKWSRHYFPTDFFDGFEDDERSVEFPYFTSQRAFRCLWLGARIASV